MDFKIKFFSEPKQWNGNKIRHFPWGILKKIPKYFD